MSKCGWVWVGVDRCGFKGFLFVMYFCQVFVVLAGCIWVWVGVAGGGWGWLGVGRCGWVWLGAVFRTALLESNQLIFFNGLMGLANLCLLGRFIFWLVYGQL